MYKKIISWLTKYSKTWQHIQLKLRNYVIKYNLKYNIFFLKALSLYTHH